MNEPSYYRVSVKALVYDNQSRILLSRQSDNTWELLGGGLDHGELPAEGLKREINEEAGLEVTSISDKPQFFFTAKHQNKEAHVGIIIYEVTLKDLNFKPSEECEELAFFTPEQILKLDTTDAILQLAEKLIKE